MRHRQHPPWRHEGGGAAPRDAPRKNNDNGCGCQSPEQTDRNTGTNADCAGRRRRRTRESEKTRTTPTKWRPRRCADGGRVVSGPQPKKKKGRFNTTEVTRRITPPRPPRPCCGHGEADRVHRRPSPERRQPTPRREPTCHHACRATTHSRRPRTAAPPHRRDPARARKAQTSSHPVRATKAQTPSHPARAATGRARRTTRAPPPAAAPHSIRGPLDGMATARRGGEETAAPARRRPCRRLTPLCFLVSPGRDGSSPEGIGGPPSAAGEDALAGASRLAAGIGRQLVEDVMGDRSHSPTPHSAYEAAAT